MLCILIDKTPPPKAYINARTHFREKGVFFQWWKARIRELKKGIVFQTQVRQILKRGNNFACTCLFSSIIRHGISQHVCRVMPKCICILKKNKDYIYQGWVQIRFIKYKYKYKYIFCQSFKYKYKYKYTGKNRIKYKYKYSSSNTNTNTNTQWGRDKIAAILQMTYWILYCEKIIYTFKFHWKLFPKVQSTISLHWFR